MALLRLDGDEYGIALEIIRQAREIKRDRDRSFADYLAGHTARITVRGIARIIERALKSLG